MLLLVVVHHRALHNLHAFFEGGLVDIAIVVVALFRLLVLRAVRNVSVEDFPLGDLTLYGIARRRFCRHSSFSHNSIFRLGFSGIVVELVAHGLLDGFDVLGGTWIFELLVANGLFDEGFLHFLEISLVAGFRGLLVDDFTVKGEVNSELLDEFV